MEIQGDQLKKIDILNRGGTIFFWKNPLKELSENT